MRFFVYYPKAALSRAIIRAATRIIAVLSRWIAGAARNQTRGFETKACAILIGVYAARLQETVE